MTLVVAEAGPTLLVDPELWTAILASPKDSTIPLLKQRIKGAGVINGDIISFGVPEEGLGVVSYVRVGTDSRGYIVCTKIDPDTEASAETSGSAD